MNQNEPDGVRLQKVLARAGVASRRAAEEMIAAGRVSVDGQVVREQGRRIDPDTAVVHVDGGRVVLRDDVVHLVLNKPFGMLSTMADDQGEARRSVLPMGSLFEMGQMLLFELVVLRLRERLGETAETMCARHTNLE